ncbi:MAG TPA: hypothetical protein VLB46_11625 [Pyrinomonadaceae bacterium]|nr:hypothetical protein [Pyrinomonadaceae bacterium]
MSATVDQETFDGWYYKTKQRNGQKPPAAMMRITTRRSAAVQISTLERRQSNRTSSLMSVEQQCNLGLRAALFICVRCNFVDHLFE